MAQVHVRLASYMGEVFVVGASSTDRESGRSTAALAHDVADGALSDARIRASAITGVFVGLNGFGPAPVAAVAVRLGLRGLGFRSASSLGRPGRVEHLCPSGVEALHHAALAVELGIDELVLCIGVEQRLARPRPWETWPPRTLLRARAQEARRYVEATGATAAQLARVVTKNRRHGAFRGVTRTMSIHEVLDAEFAEWPLTRTMVAAGGQGAAALILASATAARRLVRSRVRISASVLTAGIDTGDLDGVAGAAETAYKAAGVGPEDLDCAELHDVTAVAELTAYEQLAFVPEGYGAELVNSGFTAFGGVLPINLSGGLLSLGERPAASAIAQVAELTRQLRGEAGAAQVDRARAALAHCAGRPESTPDTVTGISVLTA